MLMSLNKGETADHGCHCWGKMAVRMRSVMAIPWSWYMCHSAKIEFWNRSRLPGVGPWAYHFQCFLYLERKKSLSQIIFIIAN